MRTSDTINHTLSHHSLREFGGYLQLKPSDPYQRWDYDPEIFRVITPFVKDQKDAQLGYGSKLHHHGTADFSPSFHLPENSILGT